MLSDEESKLIYYLKFTFHKVGYCDMCEGRGPPRCCVEPFGVEFDASAITPETIEFITVRGAQLHDGKIHILVSGECPNLEPDSTCKIYADRPKVCKDFPWLPSQVWSTVGGEIVKTCSYDWDFESVEVNVYKLAEVIE